MIPEFPNWQSLDLSHKEEAERIVSIYPPYSDFNFFSMWSWDIENRMKISKLNGNLVVLFNDYITGEPFISFIGNNQVKETAKALIEFSIKNYNTNYLRLIPEDVAFLFFGDSEFEVKSDQDAYDYVYEVEHLANMHTWSQHTSGKNIRRFLKGGIQYEIKHLPIAEVNKERFLKVFQKWVKNKKMGDYTDVNEYHAFNKMLHSNHEELHTVSLCVDGILIGFTVYQLCAQNHALSHFAKADKSFYKEAGDILNWEEAKILKDRNIKYFNWEQDLGIAGLRRSKARYNPTRMLQKFTLALKSKE